MIGKKRKQGNQTSPPGWTLCLVDNYHLLTNLPRFMPTLKFLFVNATSPDLRLLRGKTIECISLIGLAVGKEKVSIYSFKF